MDITLAKGKIIADLNMDITLAKGKIIADLNMDITLGIFYFILHYNIHRRLDHLEHK